MATDMTSYGMNTTTAASTRRIKWETKLLKVAEGMLGVDKFATNKVMGRGEGKTLRLNRLLRPSKVTSATSEGQLIGYADAQQLTTNYIDLEPAFWGNSYGFTDKISIESFLSDEQNRKTIANEMARTLDYQGMKMLATQCLRHRIDKNSSYQVSGTADSGSTTTLVDDALTQSDDAWNGGYVTIVNPEGPGYDETSAVTDFVASTDTATVSFTNAITSASKYRMTVGTALAATHVMTVSGLIHCSALHRKLETEKFSGGILRAFIDGAQEADLWTDSTFLNSAIYDNSGRFERYSLGRWLDIEFMVSSEIYREDVDGTENQSTGVVYVAPIFGANAYSFVRWGMGQGTFGVEWNYVDKPDSGNLRNSAKWISWNSYWAGKVQRATSVIGLMTGATSLNLVL